MTKLSFALENHALGTVLDKFSTSSTAKLSGRFVPEYLEGRILKYSIFLFNEYLYLFFFNERCLYSSSAGE
jgi:hypothetical protein